MSANCEDGHEDTATPMETDTPAEEMVEPKVDEELLEKVLAMGFPELRARAHRRERAGVVPGARTGRRHRRAHSPGAGELAESAERAANGEVHTMRRDRSPVLERAGGRAVGDEDGPHEL